MLYGPDGPVRRRTFEEPRLGERHQFRFIVSPEDAGELDLTVYVRRLMTRIEHDLGRKIEWAAVNHYDTDHPHAHVVVRGVDRDGHELRFERGYISSGIRWSAQELATQELGPRLEFEIRRRTRPGGHAGAFHVARSRDRAAVEGRPGGAAVAEAFAHGRSVAPSRVDSSTSRRWDWPSGVSRARGRCPRTGRSSCASLGTRGDILKQMHDVRAWATPRATASCGSGEPLLAGVDAGQDALVARVAGKGLSDEMKGAFYAVLETPNGFAYHVPLDAKTAEAVRPGDLVLFGTRPELAVRPVDRRIAETAAPRRRGLRTGPGLARSTTVRARRVGCANSSVRASSRLKVRTDGSCPPT